MESARSAEDPERIFGPDKKVNLTLLLNSTERRIQQKPFLITSNRQNSLQSIHWSRIEFIYKVSSRELN